MWVQQNDSLADGCRYSGKQNSCLRLALPRPTSSSCRFSAILATCVPTFESSIPIVVSPTPMAHV